MLIEQGADPSAKDNNGKTPLQLAWNVEIKKLLSDGSMLNWLRRKSFAFFLSSLKPFLTPPSTSLEETVPLPSTSSLRSVNSTGQTKTSVMEAVFNMKELARSIGKWL
jgi:hypothetical protein